MKALMSFANVPLDQKERQEVNTVIVNSGLSKEAMNLSADILVLVTEVFNRAFM